MLLWVCGGVWVGVGGGVCVCVWVGGVWCVGDGGVSVSVVCVEGCGVGLCLFVCGWWGGGGCVCVCVGVCGCGGVGVRVCVCVWEKYICVFSDASREVPRIDTRTPVGGRVPMESCTNICICM